MSWIFISKTISAIFRLLRNVIVINEIFAKTWINTFKNDYRGISYRGIPCREISYLLYRDREVSFRYSKVDVYFWYPKVDVYFNIVWKTWIRNNSSSYSLIRFFAFLNVFALYHLSYSRLYPFHLIRYFVTVPRPFHTVLLLKMWSISYDLKSSISPFIKIKKKKSNLKRSNESVFNEVDFNCYIMKIEYIYQSSKTFKR